MKKFCLALGLLTTNFLYAKVFIIPTSVAVINQTDKRYSSLRAGDTLLMEPGVRGPIQFNNLCGSPNHNIVIINGNGLCDIQSTALPYGISIRNCHDIILSGAGNNQAAYGIKISQVEPTGAGLGVSDNSDNIEIKNLEICHINGPGILCKTNAACNSSVAILYNFSIHDNYVHHTGTEGLYIGSSAFRGEKKSCDGVTQTLTPPVLQTVLVYNNLVENTGWDGIQISDSKAVQCYANKIYYDSRKKQEWQNSGMVIGGNASGSFTDNIIAHGYGYGITCVGNKDIVISNNMITMDSALDKPAIYINDKLADDDTHYLVKDNTIETAYLPTIKMVNKKRIVADALTHNKIISAAHGQAVSSEGLPPIVKD
jgi:hypothetical protein